MNKTNLTLRQQAIANSLGSEPITREQVLDLIKAHFPVSKATLMRDINSLVKFGLIKTQGKGKATVYLSNINPVIRPLNLDDYFKEESNLRKTGRKSFNPDIFDLLHDIYSLKEIEDLIFPNSTLSLKKKELDPSIFRKEIERFTVEFAWKSSKLEGNTYSLLETEVLIKQMKEAYGRTKYEAIMILNHKNAIDYILDNSDSFKKLTIEKIIHLHSILTKELEITSGIRDDQVAITGTEFIPLKKKSEIEVALQKAVNIINKTDFPLEKALLVLALISYIQPFVDGNKRTSRALSNAILIASDLYPLSYRNLDEVEYLKSILLFYETNNLFHLKRIVTSQYKFALQSYFQK